MALIDATLWSQAVDAVALQWLFDDASRVRGTTVGLLADPSWCRAAWIDALRRDIATSEPVSCLLKALRLVWERLPSSAGEARPPEVVSVERHRLAVARCLSELSIGGAGMATSPGSLIHGSNRLVQALLNPSQSSPSLCTIKTTTLVLVWLRSLDSSGAVSYATDCRSTPANLSHLHTCVVKLLEALPYRLIESLLRWLASDANQRVVVGIDVDTVSKALFDAAAEAEPMVQSQDIRNLSQRIEAVAVHASTNTRPASANRPRRIHAVAADMRTHASLAELLFDDLSDEGRHPFLRSIVPWTEQTLHLGWKQGISSKKDAIIRAVPAVESAMKPTHSSQAIERRRFCNISAPLCDVVPPSYALERVIFTRVSSKYDELAPRGATPVIGPGDITAAAFRESQHRDTIVRRPCSSHRPHSTVHYRALLHPASDSKDSSDVMPTIRSLEPGSAVIDDQVISEILQRRPSGSDFLVRTVSPDASGPSTAVGPRRPLSAALARVRATARAAPPSVALLSAAAPVVLEARHAVMKPFSNHVPAHIARLRKAQSKLRFVRVQPVL